MYRLFIALFMSVALLANGQRTGPPLDSLIQGLAGMKNDTVKAERLARISYAYSTINPEEGIKYGQQGLTLSDNLHWSHGIASAHAGIAMNMEAMSDHEKAQEHNEKALVLYKQMADSSGMAAIYANMGLIYFSQSNHTKALQYFFSALDFNGKMDNANTQAIILENIGNIYFEQKDYPKSLKYYTKAITIHKKGNTIAGIARCYANMGRIYNAEGRNDEALKYHFMALETNEKQGNKSSVQVNLANIGYVYSQMKQYRKALEYQLKALAISEEMKNRNSIAINLGNIGETYFAMASEKGAKDQAFHLRNAVDYLEQAVAICKETGFFGPLAEFSQYLSDAYFLSGNYRRAFEVFREYTAIKDSVYSNESKVELARLEARHELDIKNKDIIIKDKQLEIANLAAANVNKERTLYIAGIVLLAVAAIMIIGKFRNRIRSQRRALKEIARIQSHDVRGPVSRMLGLVELFNYNDMTDPVNKEVIAHITATTHQIDDIINEVMNKTQEGKK